MIGSKPRTRIVEALLDGPQYIDAKKKRREKARKIRTIVSSDNRCFLVPEMKFRFSGQSQSTNKI